MTKLATLISEHKSNVVLFLTHYLGAKIPEGVEYTQGISRIINYDNIPFQVIKPKEFFDLKFYKIICLNWVLSVEQCEVDTFLNMLTEFDHKTLSRLASAIIHFEKRNYRFYPEVNIASLQTDGSEYDHIPPGAVFNVADKKIEKLTNLIYKELENISRHLAHAAKQFNSDKDKPKVDDIHLRITTDDNGVNTEFYFRVIKHPAVRHPGIVYSEVGERISDEEKNYFFDYPVKPSKNKEEVVVSRIKDKIDGSLNRINQGVHSFLTNYLNDDEEVKTYLHKIVNNQLIPSLCSINLEPYSFFGGLDASIFDGDITDRNSEVCIHIIDGETTRLLNHLEQLPIPEGSSIDHYAIDYDSFSIYGRDENHFVVEPMLDPKEMFVTKFSSFYSDSFFEMFKRHLKTIKNKYVFSKIIIDKEKSQSVNIVE